MAASGGFDRPVFLLSSPRSGSSLLFETMRHTPDAFTIGGESHALIETIAGLHPAARGWTSNRLDARDATPAVVAELRRRFAAMARDRAGRPPPDGAWRLVEKTPKNSLRVPFLDAVFPDALFVFLHRDVRQTLSSMIEAWGSGRFATYPRLPDWPPPPWSLLLVPGWRSLAGRALPDIVSHQWSATIATLLDDLAALPPSRVRALDYDRFVAAPEPVMRTLCASLGLGWDRALGAELPLSGHTVSRPDPSKWRRHDATIAGLLPLVGDTAERAARFLADHDVAA